MPFFDRLCSTLPASLMALCACLFAGCAALPTHVERHDERTLPGGAETRLGHIASESSPGEQLSGFRLMPSGAFALNTRLTLASMAELSIDAQYYVLSDDNTGRNLLRALRDAAVRGVRVRLLIDDLYNGGEDDLFLGLAAYPNVEIHLFNPFPGGRGGFLSRFVASANDIGRVNHRMHNKLFVVDGVAAVAGGRNIADEYFMRSETENFVDLDSFVVGGVVPQLEDIYDDYWNSSVVYPLGSVAHNGLSPEEQRAFFEVRTAPDASADPADIPTTDSLGYGPIADELERGRLGLIWAPAFAYADLPSKLNVDSDDMATVQYNLIELMRRAKKQVLISSPYMIPGKEGMDMFREDRKHGVVVKILTNSLAATDEPVVHTGYSRYRLPMLEMGVELYELSPSRITHVKRLGMFGRSVGRLHAKIACIDRQTVFIGSMNFDPRSAHENTELGVIIESPQLAREIERLFDLAALQSAYRLRLSPADKTLQWLATDADKAEILETEPDTNFWMQLELEILKPLAPEELL
jgi:putative cardiolipin synthase